MPRQSQKNTSNFADWLKIILQMSGIGFLICLCYWSWLQLMSPVRFPLRHVELETKKQYVSPQALLNAIQPYIHAGFFSVSTATIRQKLDSVPWVAEVETHRIWPDKLQIIVHEKQPMLRWGAKGVVSTDGNIFYPPLESIPKGLPQVDAPEGDEKDVIQEFQKITELMKGSNLRVSRLLLTQRLSSQLTFSNGITVMLGQSPIDQRFQQFMQLYPSVIGQKASQVRSVDLRYPNGFAIQWQKEKH